MSLKRIFISLTEREWEVLDERIQNLKKADVGSFLRSEIPKLKQRFDECPECITYAAGKPQERTLFITDQSFNSLQEIKSITGRPIASTIKDLIFKPLLLPNFAVRQD